MKYMHTPTPVAAQEGANTGLQAEASKQQHQRQQHVPPKPTHMLLPPNPTLTNAPKPPRSPAAATACMPAFCCRTHSSHADRLVLILCSQPAPPQPRLKAASHPLLHSHSRHTTNHAYTQLLIDRGAMKLCACCCHHYTQPTFMQAHDNQALLSQPKNTTQYYVHMPHGCLLPCCCQRGAHTHITLLLESP